MMSEISTIPFPRLSTSGIHYNLDNTITVSMPVDFATMTKLCLIFENRKYLKEIILTAPTDHTTSFQLDTGISDSLVWFFHQAMDLKRLERVVLPMEFFTGIKAIFHKLGRLPALRSLTLTMPKSYNYSTAGPFVRRALDKAIQKGIESLKRLEEVTLPTDMVTERLALVLRSKFDASVASYEGSTIRYYTIGRHST